MSIRWNSDREKMLEHKGFTAEITKLDTCYCATDIKYNNEVIKDVLSAHGETIEELKEAFKAVVDDYLDWLTEE